MMGIKMIAEIGKKFDGKKPDWSLLPLNVMGYVVKVLTFGKLKYGRNNWHKLEDLRNRYFAACLRHLEAYQNNELYDNETKLPHIAHAICCLVFILWNDIKNKRIK